jgi:hypothetical protein
MYRTAKEELFMIAYNKEFCLNHTHCAHYPLIITIGFVLLGIL